MLDKVIETFEGYVPKAMDFVVNIVIALLIFFIGKIIINFIVKLINKFLEKANVEISVRRFLKSLTRTLLYIVLIIIICNQVGINTASFIAVLGSAGLAIGLAMQGSLSNFAGGVLILILKPFKVGDYIIDNATGKEGTVYKIDLFYTTITTGDNKRITVPNGTLANSAITNVTAFGKRRVDLEVGISYSSNIGDAKAVIEKVAMTEEKVLKAEGISVFVKELAQSQVTMGLRVWAETGDYWTVCCNLNENLKNALDEAGIEIPFNQLEVHINK